MDFISAIPSYAIPFLLVLSILVFVHELGHYLAARFCGVRVEVFSIGFGRELFGYNDKHGTRWKFCWIPLGGYVQMFGDADPSSSMQDDVKVSKLTAKDKKKAFFYKPVWQRAIIVAAGPAINFVYAIIVMAAIFATQGQGYAPAQVGGLVENGAAAKAGMKIGDTITAINGNVIERFGELQRYVAINLDGEITFTVNRNGKMKAFTFRPDIQNQKDNFGFTHQIGRIGVMSVGNIERIEHTPFSGLVAAVEETWSMSVATLRAMGQMIVGTRSADEIGGVIRIGAYAKEFSDAGWLSLLMFSAMISVNLGLINLFPIPLLDGGHLMFYAYEALVGKPMPAKVRVAGVRIGYMLVIALMVFATLNDLIQLRVFKYIAQLVS
jgi:regulator of sigma E protease